MSEIIQLYKDKNKTIKVYPKTLASEVYLDENNNIINNFNEINEYLDTIMSIINNELNIEVQTFEGESIDIDNTLINKTHNLQIYGNSELIDGIENSVGEGIFGTTAFAEVQTYSSVAPDGLTYTYSYKVTNYNSSGEYSLYYSNSTLSFEVKDGYLFRNSTATGVYYFYNSDGSVKINGSFSGAYNVVKLVSGYTPVVNGVTVGSGTIPPTIAPTNYKITLVSSNKENTIQDTLEILLDEPLRSTVDGLIRDRIYQDSEGVKLEKNVSSELQALEGPVTTILEDITNLNLKTYNGYTKITSTQDSKKAIIKCNTIVRL